MDLEHASTLKRCSCIKTLLDDAYDLFHEIIIRGKTINENFRCYPDALSFIIETREDLKRDKLVNEKYRLQLNNGVFDKLVNAKLYPYQKEGICATCCKTDY